MPSLMVASFGGTSVASPDRRTIATVARERLDDGLRSLLVCSALSGVSDRLVSLADAALSETPSRAGRPAGAAHGLAVQAGLPSSSVDDELPFSRASLAASPLWGLSLAFARGCWRPENG